ncbi:MAG TPA: glycosyltransferase family 4 protein [Candidatus Saccharimonadales bacterium]|nr:glycosyltransferase family 4 protein [Candidatus Saccharimonadales bacterium]
MNILILNWRDIKHPLSGGAEISLLEHAKYWKQKGNTITWISSSFKDAKKKEVIDGITVIRKGSHYTVHLLTALSYLRGEIGKPDIVVDCFHFLPYLSPLYIPRRKVIGLINEVAGKVWFSNLFYPFAFIGYIIEPYIISFYKGIPFITGSDSAKNDLMNIGIGEDTIHVVHHGFTQLPVPEKIKKETHPTLIFLARVSVDKGIIDAIKAFVEVKKHVKNLQFWIVGKEEKIGFLQSLLNNSDFKDSKKSINYYGFVSEKEKFILLKKAWILIHPSKKEGWGLNVIEAASQATPTIGYDVEGLRDSVINGKTGLLVERQNYMALAQSISTLIVDKNKTMYNALSKNAQGWSRNFKWDVSVKKSWNIISKMYEENQQPKS